MSERASSAEFIWTGDLSWRSGHKIDLTPRLQNAYQTAVDGLAEACFDVTGNKTVYVKRVPVGKHHLGAAHNADAFSLVLDRQSATNSRYNFGFLENVRVIAHELTHQERMKHVPFDKTLTERLATEGLAILAESLVHGMLDPASITEVDRYLYTGSNYWKWKLCEFFADVQDVTESTSRGGAFVWGGGG